MTTRTSNATGAIYGWLCDTETGERVRPATEAEHRRFEEKDPHSYCEGVGSINIDGREYGYEP